MNLTMSTLRGLLPCALVAISACAPLAPQPNEYSAGRARLVLPPGGWEDLGVSNEAVPLRPEPGERVPLQTRTVALRGADHALLAVMRVQTNRTNDWPESVYWSGERCLPQQDVTVQDFTQGSRVRMDCLRFKRWAKGPRWLQENETEFAQWLATKQLEVKAPYSHLSYRYATQGGVLVAVDVLADQRLFNPRARNNREFLAAGQPALQWGRDLARAVRVSVGMMDGNLVIPPFPVAIDPP